MWFSLYKFKIEEKLKSNSKYYYISLIISIIVLFISMLFRKNIYVYSTIWVTSFVWFIVLLSMKVKINSKFLKFMGTNVFYIYIYQRIPMMILDRYNIYFGNRYLFLIISFVTITGITIIINVLKNKKRKEK